MFRWLASRDRAELVDMLRMWPTLVVALITVGIVYAIAPQQVGILVYTIAKLSLAGYLGYWLDRWIFPDARPGDMAVNHWGRTIAECRRAAIVIGALIASGLMS